MTGLAGTATSAGGAGRLIPMFTLTWASPIRAAPRMAKRVRPPMIIRRSTVDPPFTTPFIRPDHIPPQLVCHGLERWHQAETREKDGRRSAGRRRRLQAPCSDAG